jgi:preprotein translocase subunit YajC
MTTEFSQLIIREAFADSVESQKGSTFSNLMPLILIMAVFYFLVIRPQQKKNKEHSEKLKGLSRGDEIVTSGGIIATVSNVPQDGDHILVEIAKDVKVKLHKLYVADFVSKGSQKENENKPEKQEKKNNKKQEEKSSTQSSEK